MSSTNRGYDRHKADYYVTPVGKIEDFLKEFIKYESKAFDGKILDPCAGGDKKNPMSYPTALHNLELIGGGITTIDIREDSLADIKADYISYELDFKPKVIITNPPFTIAESIIKKALDDVADNGFVIMLLRLNFYGSKGRFNGFWKEVGLPKYTFVHHKRMSFTEDGKTDSIEYAHFVWQKGFNPKFSALKVI